MPIIIYFSAVVSVLYYYGVIQYVLLKMAWIMNFLMDTSPAESIVTVASMLVLIKPREK